MIIVADNLHVVNPHVADALVTFDADPVQDLVLKCQKAGAQAIDINSGPVPSSPRKTFSFLVEAVQSVCDLPLVLDTTNPRAMAAGLKACRGRAIVNGFSLETAKIEHILPLAADHDADVIGYLLGPNSQVPIEADEMMAIAVEIFEAFVKTGMPIERLIIDPVIAPLSWDNGIRHNQAVLAVLRSLPDLFGAPVRTIAGISNLASGPIPTHRKIELEKAFLPMLAAAGLDMALLNIFHQGTVHTAKTCDALLGEKIFSWAHNPEA